MKIERSQIDSKAFVEDVKKLIVPGESLWDFALPDRVFRRVMFLGVSNPAFSDPLTTW